MDLTSPDPKKRSVIRRLLLSLLILGVATYLYTSGEAKGRSDATREFKQTQESILPAISEFQVPVDGSLTLQTIDTNGVVDEAKANEMVLLLNEERGKQGLANFKVNPELTKLASDYAIEIASTGKFSHTDSQGHSPFERMLERNITYQAAGENLVLNTSISSALGSLLRSPSHRANILNPSYTEIGVGVVRSDKLGLVIVQEFRRPR